MATRRLIIETDGGSRGNPGPAGYGAVVKDGATEQIIAETAEYLGRTTNNVAEYRGLIAGLRAAHAIDPDARIDVRMDSKLVVEQMSGRWKIKHPDMLPLAAEARGIFPRAQLSFTWIPRSRNKDADRLANEAMDAGQAGRQWQPRKTAAARPPEAVNAASAVPAADEETPAPVRPAGWAAAPTTVTTFVLLRHGETLLTPEKRFSGGGSDAGDPELSERGLQQSTRAAAALAARGTVQAVVSSPLKRARQTAETVAARLGLEVRIEQGIRETDFGAWEGLTFAEVQHRYPDELSAWLASPETAPPGGESFADTSRRVALSRDKLLARYAGRTVLLVTHVTPIKTLVRLALGAPPESLFRMELSAAALSAVQYYSDGNTSLRLFNDTGHLR